MSNLLEKAINCDDRDHAAKIIPNALGIESDDVVNYTFPKNWPADREQRAAIIGEWLQTEAGLTTRADDGPPLPGAGRSRKLEAAKSGLPAFIELLNLRKHAKTVPALLGFIPLRTQSTDLAPALTCRGFFNFPD
jgi:hypothetical protein